jgi:hypothetical protein
MNANEFYVYFENSGSYTLQILEERAKILPTDLTQL